MQLSSTLNSVVDNPGWFIQYSYRCAEWYSAHIHCALVGHEFGKNYWESNTITTNLFDWLLTQFVNIEQHKKGISISYWFVRAITVRWWIILIGEVFFIGNLSTTQAPITRPVKLDYLSGFRLAQWLHGFPVRNLAWIMYNQWRTMQNTVPYIWISQTFHFYTRIW